MKRLLMSLGYVCLLAASMDAQVKRTSDAVRIDGQLDDAAWAEAEPIRVAYEWYPGDDTPAPVETTVRIAFDDRNLYAAFDARDPNPSRIRARFSERDGAGDDDLVGLYIDPFNDDRRAYQFRINPLGVQIDAINSDVEGTEDFSWDGIWESAGRVTADGYVVEIAIPLQQLRVPAARGPQTWGFLAVREWPRDVLHRLRSTTTDQNRNCFICQFHDVAGFEIGRVGRNAEVTPTLTGSIAQERVGRRLETVDDTLDVGVSARWAMTPGTSLQATFNPDFSQVEADAAQLDVNTRFALFFPEKRPFFVEGSDFFETRLPLVFTRTIADPSGGLKLTGKSGPHAYGVLFARDEITNLLVPGDQSSSLTTIPGGSTTGIARYRRELGSNTTAGGLLTVRRGVDYENTLVSFDAFHRLNEQDSLRVQMAGSRTADPGTSTSNGHALLARYSHNDRNWSYSGEYEELSPEFRADTGFVNQVGVRAGSAGVSRRIRGGPDRWFRNLFLGVSGDAIRSFDGTCHSSSRAQTREQWSTRAAHATGSANGSIDPASTRGVNCGNHDEDPCSSSRAQTREQWSTRAAHATVSANGSIDPASARGVNCGNHDDGPCSSSRAQTREQWSTRAAQATGSANGSIDPASTRGVNCGNHDEGPWNEWGSDITATYEGPRQTTVSVLLAPNQEYYQGTTYHHFRYSLSGSTQLSRDVSVGMAVRWGEAIDFTNLRGADFVTLSPYADFNIGRRIRGEIAYDHQWFDTKDGRRIFTVGLPQARFLYHFSGRAFARAIVQYRSLEREPALYLTPVTAKQNDLLTQLLISYRLDAQTVFLAGYSDDYDGATDLTQNARAVFVKLSYAWLF